MPIKTVYIIVPFTALTAGMTLVPLDRFPALRVECRGSGSKQL